MVIINEKGSVQQKVTIQKRGKGKTQHIMLKNVLINKSENYHLQVDRFMINDIPELIQRRRPLVKIRPRYPLGRPAQDDATNQIDGYHVPGFLADFTMPHAFYIEKYKFEPTVFSVAGLVGEFGKYIRNFNYILFLMGADHSAVGFGNASAIPEYPLQHNQYDLGTYVPENDVVDHIKIGFESDGAVVLHLSRGFLSNFYLEFDDVFAKILGFPTLIYSYVDGAGLVHISNQEGVPDLFVAGDFNLALGAPDLGATGFESLISTGSIFKFDERISIDIEIALPLSRTIDVLDRVERHTFILSRFMLSDYKELETIIEQRGGVILTKSILQDTLALGCVDLVRGQPQTHTAMLLNGKIQALDLRLVLRYKEYFIDNAEHLAFSIKHKTHELDEHGFYDILLHFIKKL